MQPRFDGRFDVLKKKRHRDPVYVVLTEGDGSAFIVYVLKTVGGVVPVSRSKLHFALHFGEIFALEGCTLTLFPSSKIAQGVTVDDVYPNRNSDDG